MPSSEVARDLLTQKLHAVQHKSPTPVGVAYTSSSDGQQSIVPTGQSAVQPEAVASSGGASSSSKGVVSEANPAPSHSANTGTPLPPLQPLPVPKAMAKDQIVSMQFAEPRKRIVSPNSMKRWETSSTFDEVLGFVMACNDAVVGRRLTEDIPQSPAVQAIVAILDSVAAVIKDVPPESGSSSRFGNPAFRTFYARVKEQSRALHETIPGLREIKGRETETSDGEKRSTDAIGEIETYLIECFGNEKRIDYGSGMELNFVCWLLCLVKLGVLNLANEAPAIVLRIFWRYIEVMRQVQSTYWLEPAGSHGVWGLDDYHFLPFLFGSAQLKGHKIFRPKSIHDNEILDDFSKDYMYFACIRFINSVSRDRSSHLITSKAADSMSLIRSKPPPCAGTRPCWTTSAA